MNIVVLQENITAALSKASRFLPSKTSAVSSVNNFLITAEDGVITLRATDLETSLTTIIAGKVVEEGSLLLPAKLSLSLLPNFSGEKISLSLQKQIVVIKGETTQASLKTEPSESFPEEKINKANISIKIKGSDLSHIVSKNSTSVSSDQSRAVLTGMLFSIKKNNLTCVSTDGFRLSVYQTPLTGSEWEGNIILPAKAVCAFAEAMSGEKDISLEYVEKDKKVSVSTKNDRIITRIIDGAFPNYQKIIPQGAQTTATIDRKELLRAVKLSSVFARESANIVRVKIKGDKLTLLAKATQTGTNETKLNVKKEGEDIETAFNYKFLLDLLNSLKSDEVTFESNGPLQPGMFHKGDKNKYFHIIMPVRLQESK